MAGGIRSGNGDEMAELSEINVTPFIDVMLVLLIIFMVAAPLATVDVPVDLPASTAQSQPPQDKPLYLTIQKDLTLSLNENAVAADALGAALDSTTSTNRDTRIFLRADQTVPYKEIMAAMNLLRAAGYLKVALVGLDQAPVTAGADVAAP